MTPVIFDQGHCTMKDAPDNLRTRDCCQDPSQGTAPVHTAASRRMLSVSREVYRCGSGPPVAGPRGKGLDLRQRSAQIGEECVALAGADRHTSHWCIGDVHGHTRFLREQLVKVPE